MIFKRNSEADNALFLFFNKVGWVVLFYNAYTLYPYFYDLLKTTTDYWQRIFASGVAVALILGIESSTMTVLSDPRVLIKVLEKPRVDKEVKQFFDIVSFMGIAAFLIVASYTFWTDYAINLKQLGNPSMMFLKILCGVFVIGAELAFGCANIFLIASKEAELNDSRR
jgi:hypothetical protein